MFEFEFPTGTDIAQRGARQRDHDTGMATVIAEMLGIGSIDSIRLLWGDSDIAPPSDQWFGSLTLAVQGGAALMAAKKLRTELLNRAAQRLRVDAAALDLRDGVIRSKRDLGLTVAASELLDGKSLRMRGQTKTSGHGRSLAKGIGACFVEVDVDTWTGQFRLTRVVYSHDTGKIVNPLIAVADMEGSFMESFQITTRFPTIGNSRARCIIISRFCPSRSRQSWNPRTRSTRFSSRAWGRLVLWLQKLQRD